MKFFDENDSIDLKTTYGYNVIYLCFMLKREMINYNRIQSFFETFL